MKASAGRTCMFCGAQGPLTLEHVWPRWVGDVADAILADTGALGMPWIAKRGGTLRTAYGLDATGRVVCGPCNTGWMSGMEGAIRPLLSPMIRGYETYTPPKTPIHTARLTTAEQEMIAAWAFKTALIIDRVRPSRHLTDAIASAFHAERKPPTNCMMWLGSYGGAGMAFAARFSDMPVAVSKYWTRDGIWQAGESYRNGVVITLNVYRIVAQIAVFDDTDLPAMSSLADRSTETEVIWPPQPTHITWPVTGRGTFTEATMDPFLERTPTLTAR